MEIRTAIRINAPIEKVWAILSDFPRYAEWNPFITSLTGDMKVGDKIKVRIEPPGASVMNFKPKVLSFIPNKELSWLGQLLFTGVFDGAHKLALVDNGDGTTTFNHSEKFSGLLVPLFKKQLEANTTRGFELMNAKLKEQAEKR